MTRQSPVVRLHLFFASDNDTAVILRQGPSEVFRLILWNRSSDTFEDGQWLKQKVYVDRCDLSPDGKHFIYFTLNGDWSGESEGAYTVLSRPPWFTALALFPEGSTWGGGGRFFSNTEFYASGGEDIIGDVRGLERLRTQTNKADGSIGLYDLKGRHTPFDPLALSSPPVSRTSSALDYYDTQGGVLSRRRGHELDPIRDFNDMVFERLRAPYDHRAPGAVRDGEPQ